jgi:hypothetical protein
MPDGELIELEMEGFDAPSSRRRSARPRRWRGATLAKASPPCAPPPRNAVETLYAAAEKTMERPEDYSPT